MIIFSLSEAPAGLVHSVMDHSFLTNVLWPPLPVFLFFIFCSIISETSTSLPVAFPCFLLMNPQITAVMVAKNPSRTGTSVYQEQNLCI